MEILVAAILLPWLFVAVHAGDAPCDFDNVSLRQQADSLGLDVGVATGYGFLTKDPTTSKLVAKEFNMLTTENELKMDRIYTPSTMPGKGTFDFSELDFMVSYALANNMKIRGHTLFYHAAMPHGLTQWRMPRQKWREWATDYLCTVMTRYTGKIGEWDVVNEAITVASVDGVVPSYGNGFRKTFFSKVLGADYLDFLFRKARECDPDAKLFLNDYSIELTNDKSDRLFQIVREYRRRGVPIDGVGMQGHISSFFYGSEHWYTNNFERFAQEGILLSFSELDIMVLCRHHPKHFQAQGDLYYKFVRWALDFRPHFTSVVVWGVLDSQSWVNGNSIFPCKGDPLLFDSSGNRKFAYFAFQQALCEYAPLSPIGTPSPSAAPERPTHAAAPPVATPRASATPVSPPVPSPTLVTYPTSSTSPTQSTSGSTITATPEPVGRTTPPTKTSSPVASATIAAVPVVTASGTPEIAVTTAAASLKPTPRVLSSTTASPTDAVDTSKQIMWSRSTRYEGKNFQVKEVGYRYGQRGWMLSHTGSIETTFLLDGHRDIVVLCEPKLYGRRPPRIAIAVDGVLRKRLFLTERRHLRIALNHKLTGFHEVRIRFMNGFRSPSTGAHRGLAVIHATWQKEQSSP